MLHTKVGDVNIYRVCETGDIELLVKVISEGQGHHGCGQRVRGGVPDIGIFLSQHHLRNNRTDLTGIHKNLDRLRRLDGQ